MSWWKNTWERLTDWDRNPIYTSVRDEHDAITEKMINAYLKWEAFGNWIVKEVVQHSIQKSGLAWESPTVTDKIVIGWLMGKAAVPELIKAVGTEDKFGGGGNRRAKACKLLRRIKDPRAVPALIEAFRENDINVRDHVHIAVTETLGPKEAEKTFRECLKSDKWETRRTAIEGLAAMARYLCKEHEISEETVDEMIKLLEDDMSAISHQVCSALGDIGNPKAIPVLLKAYKGESNAWHREIVIIQVALLKGTENAEEEALEKIRNGDAGERNMAAEMLMGLTRIRAHTLSDGVIPALIKVLDEDTLTVRKAAALSLANIGGAKAVEGMLKSLEIIDKDVWRNAISALQKIEPERKHLKMLQRAAWRVRKVGRKVIGRPYTAKEMAALMGLHVSWTAKVDARVSSLVQKKVIPANFKPKAGKPTDVKRVNKLVRVAG